MNWQRAWLSLGAFILAGCAAVAPSTHVTWIGFDEAQQSWPTSATGFMRMVDGFPVYGLGQLPPNPYEVLGYIYVASVVSNESPEPAEERQMVALAREKGGQAALCTKQARPGAGAYLRQTDFVIVKFKQDLLADALDRINIYLALTAGSTNGYSTPDGHGGAIHYSAAEVTATRAELEKARQIILARPEFRHSNPPPATSTNTPPHSPF